MKAHVLIENKFVFIIPLNEVKIRHIHEVVENNYMTYFVYFLGEELLNKHVRPAQAQLLSTSCDRHLHSYMLHPLLHE